jgi:hypothetical protein
MSRLLNINEYIDGLRKGDIAILSKSITLIESTKLEHKQLAQELIDAILQQNYLTPSGPSKVGPENAAAFQSINSQLKTILSANNYLSKT